MRFSLAATVGALLGLALILSACGGERAASADKPESGVSDTVAEKPASIGRTCRRQLHGFLAAMDALRTDLARGLSYRDYLGEVRGVRAAYGRIPAGQLAVGCLLASGGPAERAFNFYIDAANTWGECLTTASCDTTVVEPALQRKWALASARLSLAQRGLRASAHG
jgi:hypothetical protein